MSENSLKTLSVNRKSKQPLHVQVEALLRNLIKSPKFRNGAFLPRETDLAEKLGIARNTIRQATNKLVNEGLLIRKKGVGTTAAPKKALQTSWYSFTQEMKLKGVNAVNLKISLEKVRADEKIAGFFNVKSGCDITKLSKLKGVDGESIAYFESYLHPNIQLSNDDDLDKPLYQLLEEKYQITAQRSSEHIIAIINRDIAKKLQIKANAPILFRERMVYDTADLPIEYNRGYYRSDKLPYSVEK